jgi:hypothetical protein
MHIDGRLAGFELTLDMPTKWGSRQHWIAHWQNRHPSSAIEVREIGEAQTYVERSRVKQAGLASLGVEESQRR